MPEEPAIRRRDMAIARLAGQQHGVISSAQLTLLGVSTSSIGDRVSAGRLHRIHRGVYAVGQPKISNEGRWMAAVLACGEGAVLSHVSAAALWTILPRGRARSSSGDRSVLGLGVGMVDVTVLGHGGRATRNGIRVHRSATLSLPECTRRLRIPVTRPARTLQDLRGVLSSPKLAAARREAEYLGLPLDALAEPNRSRSDLETLFFTLCRRHRLPQPEVNVQLDRFIVDFLWRKERLIVEVDGWEAHRSRSAFEEDRARDARLKLLGYEVLRFTWRQIENTPREVARVLRMLLRR
jgi:very-short-patch-repair endonuclease